MGRTARAGESGIVTSLYTEANRDLVRAVREAEELAQPVVRLYFLSLLFALFDDPSKISMLNESYVLNRRKHSVGKEAFATS